MKVIVDTSIWSLALRRRAIAEGALVAALRDLVESGQAVMLGCIRQEILSGIISTDQFTRLRDEDFKKFQRVIPVALFNP